MKELVWDLFVRLFHWSLVLSFALAYLTAEYGFDDIHELLGYFITILVVSRIVWGFIGSKYARFASFIFPVAEYIENMKAIMTNNHQKHYMGHNPLGGGMVFMLLLGVFVLVTTGLVLLGWEEYTGPVWALNIAVSESFGDLAKDIHYALPVIMLFLIGGHLMGVVLAVKQHGENLVRSMVTGYKEKHDN